MLGGGRLRGRDKEEEEAAADHEEGELEVEAPGGGGEISGDELFDPDSLTYIDEKLQNVLGHFQKDFEGGVLSENLGSQYGGYGSFLPTYQRSPSVVCQSRSPVVPLNHGSTCRSPPVESAQNSHLFKAALESRKKEDYCERTSSGINGNPHRQMLNRAVNGPDKKTPKIRIKVNSNRNLARNAAAIYSGLGLYISPSSSMDDSLDGSAEAPDTKSIPDESPCTILQIMTCLSIPGGILLSPLAENILQLREKSTSVAKKDEAPAFDDNKAELSRDWCHTASVARDKKYQMTKKIKYDEKKDLLPNIRSSKWRHANSAIMNKGTLPDLHDISDDTDSIVLPKKTEQHSVEELDKMVAGVSNHLKETKSGTSKGRIYDKSLLRDIESIVDVKAVNLANDGNQPKVKANKKASTVRNSFGDLSRDSNKESTIDQGFLGKIKYDPAEFNDQHFTTSSRLQNALPNDASLERDRGKGVHVKDELSQYRANEIRNLLSAESMGIITENKGRNPSGMPKGKTKISHVQNVLPVSRKKLKVKAHTEFNSEITGNSYGEAKNVKPEKETVSSGETDKDSEGARIDGGPKTSPMIAERSAAAPPSCMNETVVSSVSVPAVEPVLINEQWVCCDKCEKWRLLPYGMNPDLLPKKWRCSMLSWLLGMNNCKVSEDETTKALRDLYMVPAPENNIILDDHPGIATSGAYASMHPTKCDVKSITTSEKLKVGSNDLVNVSNNSNMVDKPEPSKKLHAPTSINPEGVDCFPKHKEKRKHVGLSDKGENFVEDRIHPKLKCRVGVDHDNRRASKKMKKEFSKFAKHHPFESEISKSSPSIKETSKNVHQHTGVFPRVEKYGSCSSAKCNQDKVMSDGGIRISDEARSNLADSSIKIRKSKQRLLSKRGREAGDAFVKHVAKEALIDSTGAKEKVRPELKFQKSGDRTYAQKEFLSEQHQENIVLQHPLLTDSLTRRDICSGHVSTAATSSSPKVSSSHKSKVDFQETRASPVESVSSSPLRTSDKNLVDQHKNYSGAVAENGHSQESGKSGSSFLKEKYDVGCSSDHSKSHVLGVFNGDIHNHVLKDGGLQKDRKDFLTDECITNEDSGLGIKTGKLNPVMIQKTNPDALSKHGNTDEKKQPSHQNGKTPSHSNPSQSDHAKLTYGKHPMQSKPDRGNVEPNDLKINPCTAMGSKEQPSLNNIANGDVSYNAKQSKKAVIENMKQININCDTSNVRNTTSLLKEARDLKHLSKRLKEKGDDLESASMCFEAALKFLYVASLLESSITDCSKQGDAIQTMRLYSETGNLCGFCAREFERLKKMANAALAYKCVEVAYMKAAFYKHPGAIKDKHALQATTLMVPPAESPSSSASDVDNLNYQSTATKAVSARALYSPQIAGSSIPRNSHHLMGLLAYAEDINYAFDGTRKSQSSFSSYVVDIGKGQVNDIALVREVLEFSFHNVKGLLQLIRHTLESINHESGK